MRSRFSKHPSQFVDHTRRRRERTFRSATAFSPRPLGTDLSDLEDIAVLGAHVRPRSLTAPSPTTSKHTGAGQHQAPGIRPGPAHLMVDGTR